jgi:hypothetical protein
MANANLLLNINNASTLITSAMSKFKDTNMNQSLLSAQSLNQTMDDNKALSMLSNEEQFTKFDNAAKGGKPDGLISRKDLEAVLNDNTGKYSDEDKRLAEYLLKSPIFKHLDNGSENRDFMDKSENQEFYSKGGDGIISIKDIFSYKQDKWAFDVMTKDNLIDQIDKSSNGESDGVVTEQDLVKFWVKNENNLSPDQKIAIAHLLNRNAVDGKEGAKPFLSTTADVAGNVSTVASSISMVATVATMVCPNPLTGTLAVVTKGISLIGPAVSAGASVVEMTAGIGAGEKEHITSGAIGIGFSVLNPALPFKFLGKGEELGKAANNAINAVDASSTGAGMKFSYDAKSNVESNSTPDYYEILKSIKEFGESNPAPK